MYANVVSTSINCHWAISFLSASIRFPFFGFVMYLVGLHEFIKNNCNNVMIM
jgi:hypothetical protein